MARRSSALFRLALASCAIAMAIALAACGDSDDDKADANSGSTAPAGESTAAAPKPTTDEGQIKAVAESVEKEFHSGDGSTICDGLSERGQRDLIAYGHAVGLSGGCVDVAKGVVEREREANTVQRPTQVVSVRVRGSQAVALIRISGASTMKQRYVKEDGDWKIGTFNLAATVGADGS
jgi:hypothetical protein